LPRRNQPGGYNYQIRLVVEVKTILIRQGVRQAARPSGDLRHLTSSEVQRTGQTPDHQELERFARHLRMSPESDGLILNTFGRSSATIIPTTSLRAQLLCKLCIGELRFPTVRANRHRASPDARRTLRSPPGSSESNRTPSGVRRQPAPLEPSGADSGLSRPVARPAERGRLRSSTESFGSPSCGMTPPSVLGRSPELRLHRIS